MEKAQGRQLLAAISEREDAYLVGASDAPGQPSVGLDSSVLSGGNETGIAITDNAQSLLSDTGVIIDFTAPDGKFVEKTDQAVMTGGVRVVTSTGYDITSEVVHSKLDMSELETDSVVVYEQVEKQLTPDAVAILRGDRSVVR